MRPAEIQRETKEFQPRAIVKILVVNTGSTTVKLALMDAGGEQPEVIHSVSLAANGDDPKQALQEFLSTGERPQGVAHRVVHGGEDMVESRRLDQQTIAAIEALGDIAPLHNPPALEWIRASQALLDLPQVAVFDTAFFAGMPAVASRYALPDELAARLGIRRYGFHGIAHRTMWQRWCELRPDLPKGGRLLTLQLGGGCSITALRNGIPQDTSMGFSPTEGLVMATRCGDLDPEVLLQLLRQGNMSVDEVEQLINEQSGLLGLSGQSADLRDLVDSDAAPARLAVELYAYRLRKYIGAYQAVLGGADGIVFGGGVGENMPLMRERALLGMQWCGILLDPVANRQARGREARIGKNDSPVDLRVVPVDEAAILAVEARQILQRK